mgnify:CR=1 FL=1
MPSLAERAERAAAIAAQYAQSVDKDGRFPGEALAAMREQRLLSAMIPAEFGGDEASLSEIAEACSILGQSCASAAMVFAMHQIKASSLIWHGRESPWHRDFMRRVSAEQLLLGSATTEGGIGGDLRSSLCAIEADGEVFSLTKEGTCISYGLQSDAILITARRAPDSPPSDQVMAIVTKDQYTLDMTLPWDALGMRGTCSDSFTFKAKAPAEQILPSSFADIAAQSMLGTAHLLWGSVWYGVAADAVTRAQAFVRNEAKKRPNFQSPGALRLAELANMLQAMRSNVQQGLRRYESAHRDGDDLASMGFIVAMNNIKTAASRAAFDIVNHALLITGIWGYRNNTAYSVGRHMRDVLSAPVMISNDRIFSNTSNLLLIHRLDMSLAG